MKYNKNIEWEINEDLLPPVLSVEKLENEESPIITLLRISIMVLLPLICISKLF